MTASEEVSTNNSIKISVFFIRFGVVLILVALTFLLITLFPVIKEEFRYVLINADQEVLVQLPGERSSRDSDTSADAKKDIYIITPVETDFSIVIPKIRANAKIIKDVDPNNPAEYQQKLTQGVAHAKGTSTPQDHGNTFLFAHSSDNFYNANRYNSIFYLLHKLEEGEDFYIIQNNTIYKYWIIEKSIVNADATTYLTGNNNEDDQTATLMTCWPPGTTLKRLVVVGELVEIRNPN